MENSMNSMSKAIISKEETSEPAEESGWTIYSSLGLESPSLVSDAASLAGKSSKRLSFKKRKAKGVLVDDALEDTASSPVNSPKVCNLAEMDMNAIRNNNTGISQEKSVSGQIDERSGPSGRDSDCTELKNRGLCLVPLSMLVNYFG
ncbi:hypothetical protein RGQ29_026989 [Quercus rubra]|uniref:Uncharacterized protein n=1 Tax=Quercus rubra TaxID=3512 RepID=A0AAN7EN75_QUERU|nr:hypothetical protein RGQ29_026989 [Quercus rubra]